MMGRLVNCPECGGVTHPFAEQLVAGSPPETAPKKVVSAAESPSSAGRHAKVGEAHQLRHCDNCGRLIGRLEKSHVWRGNLVCLDCYAHLPHGEVAVPVKTAKRGKPEPVAVTAEPTPLPEKPVQVLKARRVSRAAADAPAQHPRPPSRLSLFLATRPGRAMLAICTVALGIYFVYSFLQVIGLVANLLVVGLLLLGALFFLLRPGPQLPENSSTEGERSLARRP
jgi:hypothetical protein